MGKQPSYCFSRGKNEDERTERQQKTESVGEREREEERERVYKQMKETKA